MIEYRDDEEKIVTLHFADRLEDEQAKKIIEAGVVTSKVEASYLGKFFWSMNTKAIADDKAGISIPCEGSSEYWIERIYNTWEGYMINKGYEDEWDRESDNA